MRKSRRRAHFSSFFVFTFFSHYWHICKYIVFFLLGLHLLSSFYTMPHTIFNIIKSILLFSCQLCSIRVYYLTSNFKHLNTLKLELSWWTDLFSELDGIATFSHRRISVFESNPTGRRDGGGGGGSPTHIAKDSIFFTLPYFVAVGVDPSSLP